MKRRRKNGYKNVIIVGSYSNLKEGMTIRCPNCLRARKYIDSPTIPVIFIKYDTCESMCPTCCEMVSNRGVFESLGLPGINKKCNDCRTPFESFWKGEHFCGLCSNRNSNQYFPK